MTARIAGVVATVAGLVVVILPAFTWFTVETPLGDASVSGFGASGVLWVLPLVGGLGALIGILVARRPPAPSSPEAHWGGGVLAVLGALAVFWSLWVALDPPVSVVLADGDSERSVGLGVARAPALFAAPVAGAVMVLAGAGIVWPGSRR